MPEALFMIVDKDENITLVPPTYNAAETERIISRMAFLAGAKMHFAAPVPSSGMPALSLGYNIKAQGIYRDIFGHPDCCPEPKLVCEGCCGSYAIRAWWDYRDQMWSDRADPESPERSAKRRNST